MLGSHQLVTCRSPTASWACPLFHEPFGRSWPMPLVSFTVDASRHPCYHTIPSCCRCGDKGWGCVPSWVCSVRAHIPGVSCGGKESIFVFMMRVRFSVGPSRNQTTVRLFQTSSLFALVDLCASGFASVRTHALDDTSLQRQQSAEAVIRILPEFPFFSQCS